ncbi:MAG: DUF4870 domain-containing protein [Verrucomicrobiales bacterium]
MSDEPPPPLEDSDATPVPPPMSPPSELGGNAVGLGQGKLSEADERNMAMLAHLLGGLASFLGPLVIWLMKREESPFVNDQGREALNFQITVAIGMAVLGIVSLIPFVGCVAVIAFLLSPSQIWCSPSWLAWMPPKEWPIAILMHFDW